MKLKIYDNPKWFARYTVVDLHQNPIRTNEFPNKNTGTYLKLYTCLSVSGVNKGKVIGTDDQCNFGEHLGKQVSFNSLPKKVKEYIKEKFNEL